MSENTGKEKTISEIASLGGKARAEKLSPEERSASARKAVEARWEKEGEGKTPRATHEAVLEIGATEIPCAVLDNGMRVLSQGAFLLAIGRAEKAKGGQGSAGMAVDELPPFLAADNLNSSITEELRRATNPLVFRSLTGQKAFGYDAMILPLVCEVYLRARRDKKLRKSQEHIAERCEVLQSGFARVGIIALIDEATGYQYDRPRRDLEEYLKKYLSESLRKWVRTFPADYFKHLCRLRGVELRPDMRLPQYFGTLTNNIIYRRMAPGLLKKLKERRSERGNSRDKLHCWLSQDVGVPEALIHLGTVIGLMKLHTDYATFEKQLDQIAPIYPEYPGLFDDPKDWEPR
jgi:P63C domain